MGDNKLVRLIVAENNEGRRGLFQTDSSVWAKKGDLLWSLGKFWEILNVEDVFDDSHDYQFILTCCDLYEVTMAKIDAWYNKHDVEE